MVLLELCTIEEIRTVACCSLFVTNLPLKGLDSKITFTIVLYLSLFEIRRRNEDQNLVEFITQRVDDNGIL